MTNGALVVYATKHGATREIAERIAKAISAKGVPTKLANAADDENVASYDAVIAGSAVYIGRMRKEMRRFLAKNETALKQKPVWLFASGPTKTGDDPGELDGWHKPAKVSDLIKRLKPRDRKVFGGAIQPEKLQGMERWVMNRVGAPAEDVRDWDAISAWAESIASQVR